MDRACQKGEGGGSAAMVIMMIICVLVDKLLCHGSRGWTLIFKNLPPGSVWVGGYAPSYLALNGEAPHKPGGHGPWPVPKDPQVTRRGSYGHVAGLCLFYGHGGKPSIVSLLIIHEAR
jgi:hypothetical protein